MGSIRKGILERLSEGPVIGDGGCMFAMEKRGYIKAGDWIADASVTHPDALRQLHKDYLRAGADVIQCFTHGGSEESLRVLQEHSGQAVEKYISAADVNTSAYKLAREVADSGSALISISISESLSYRVKGAGREEVLKEFRNQLSFYKGLDVDFIICEYFPSVEEMEWAIEAAKETDKPVAATMCVGPHSDMNGVPTGECAVRMAKAGADIVGVNCSFGPDICLRSIKIMNDTLESENLHPYLMTQSLGYHTPEVETGFGYMHLPEHFLANEPRAITRFEAQQYARQAFELGVRYIGGCCGFEPYHIRAISEELSGERGKQAPITIEFGNILSGIQNYPRDFIKNRSSKEVWQNMVPATGRPYSPAMAKNLYFPKN